MLMPRGRKGSPQESIDSILLAISRREDIDVEIMSHYLDRLDEEWAEGARDKVLHLLRSSDAMAQSAALRILTELATDFDIDELEDFVTDPTVSDLAKLSLSPILKELGSDMADEGIVEYLNDPAGAIRQMQMRLLDLVGQNEMGVETILEDVVSMPMDRRYAFVSWLGNSNDPRAASLLIPLLENQTGKMASAIIEALEQLGPIAVNLTIPALNYVITTSSNRQVKQHARAALGRLTMQSMLGTEDVAMMEAKSEKLPLFEVRVSSLDGSGTQLIMLSWLRPDGLVKGINILFQDQLGLKDCYGIDEMNKEQWRVLVDDLHEQGFSSYIVPFDYARAILTNARVITRRARRKVPIAYSIWRPLIDAGAADKKNPPGTDVVLPPVQLDEHIKALSEQGEQLYQVKEFLSWLYEPVERLEPFIHRYWILQGQSTQKPRKKRVSAVETQKIREALEQLVNEALDVLIDEKWREQYESRLRRQAAIFAQVGRKDESDLICAVAALLRPDSLVPVREQAFPRAFMRLSIEQGPLRLMIESLQNSLPDAIPLDLINPIPD
ncbi:MAG TPA: hypothetical protein VL461_02135 [Dictyobacter sp.]|nr:hypothetical protein [Dictyobacter sp.]